MPNAGKWSISVNLTWLPSSRAARLSQVIDLSGQVTRTWSSPWGSVIDLNLLACTATAAVYHGFKKTLKHINTLPQADENHVRHWHWQCTHDALQDTSDCNHALMHLENRGLGKCDLAREYQALQRAWKIGRDLKTQDQHMQRSCQRIWLVWLSKRLSRIAFQRQAADCQRWQFVQLQMMQMMPSSFSIRRAADACLPARSNGWQAGRGTPSTRMTCKHASCISLLPSQLSHQKRYYLIHCGMTANHCSIQLTSTCHCNGKQLPPCNAGLLSFRPV